VRRTGLDDALTVSLGTARHPESGSAGVTLAPVALFVYRRPEHTIATVEALLGNPEAPDTDVVVFSDGARVASDEESVGKVRSYVRTISGFRSTALVERTENLGLAGSIIDGVTRLCAERGRIVVVEDDLIVAPHFLEYMNRALDLYAHEERVMQVSGYMFPASLDVAEDALFLPLTTSWGWATWERSWRQFDPTAKGRVELAQNPDLRQRFNLHGAYDYAGMLEAQVAGRIDSWAIRWYLTVFLRAGLVLYPTQTLVHNWGSGDNATHGAVPAGWSQAGAAMDFRVKRFPTQIVSSPAFGSLREFIRQTSGGDRRGIKGKLYELLAKAKGKR